MKTLQYLTMLFITVYLSSCGSKTQEIPAETDEEAIVAVEAVVQKLFDEVWSGYDETAVTKYQTADFLLLEHGEVWNNDTIINWCKKAQKRDVKATRVNSFKRIDARKNGNKLWLAYHNTGVITIDTLTYNLGWLESVVAVKKDSIWKLELMHSTRIPSE